jgi:hypothetical protein
MSTIALYLITSLTPPSTLSALAGVDDNPAIQEATNGPSNGTKQRKAKRSKEDEITMDPEFHDPEPDMSTSQEKMPAKKKRNKSTALLEVDRVSSMKKTKKGKQSQSPIKARKEAIVREDTPPPAKPAKGKCLRCREKRIRCNEAKPTCNQCSRGLWTCQYEQSGIRKRSKNGCKNCRTRRRKCTEEKPSCAHCLKVDDDCEYADDA